MISIMKYLEQDSPLLSESLLRFAHLVLQGLELHAVSAQGIESDRFRVDIRALAAKLECDLDPALVLSVAGEVVRALEDYNRVSVQFIKQQASEYHIVAALLTQALATMAAGSQTTVSQSESTQTVTQLRACLKESQQRMTPALQPEIDQCTGFTRRRGAEEAIRAAFEKREQFYAGLFVVDGISAVNARFGFSVGDEMLMVFAQNLVHGLASTDRAFRWNGPAVLTLMDCAGAGSPVPAKIERLTKIERMFKVGDRSVLIPVSASWTLLRFADYLRPQDIMVALDAFIFKQMRDGNGNSSPAP